VLVALMVSSRIGRDPAAALRMLRVGAAGFLLLLAHAAPPLLARRESGRELFRHTQGQEVLAWNAWRTAWMSGYFYNDGAVREVSSLEEIVRAASRDTALVLCGPSEVRKLSQLPGFLATIVAVGPRHQTLVRLRPSS
jgi:hypothetical protein